MSQPLSPTIVDSLSPSDCGPLDSDESDAGDDGSFEWLLASMFTRCLELGYFPSVFKLAKTILVPKKAGGS